MSKKLFSFLTAFFFSAILFAQLVPPLQKDTAKTLNEVVITATKFPVKQNETGKVLTVITQQQLQKDLGKSLSEILNQQTGLIINGANNTLGTNQSVFMRGASGANTLILIDGIPVYDPSGISSEFDINNFSLYNIERIEILKGAQSTLYGSDAVAGVINIITKKSFNKPVNVNINVAAGSYSTYKGNVALSGTVNGQTYFVSYSKIKSKGFSAAYDSAGNKNFDKDGFNQDAFLANYGFKASEKITVRINGKYNINKADIDAGAFKDDKDYTYKNQNTQAGISLDYKLLKGFVRAQYNYNFVTRHFKDDSISVGGFSKYQDGKYDGASHFAELYSNIELHKNIKLLAGIDYRLQSTNQKYIYLPDYGFSVPPLSADTARAKQFSGYASFIYETLKGFTAGLGGRWNHHNVYGNNFTYSFNPSYLIDKKYKVFANISSGYRVPSLYQLYSEYGNKNLKPESSESYEGGVQYLTDKINTRIVFFKRNIKNVFAFYTNPVTYSSKYINADRQKDYGVETELAIIFSEKISLAANFTFVDGKIYTKDFSGIDTVYHNLSKRPKNTFNFTVNYKPVNEVYLSTHFKTVSNFYEEQYAALPYKLPGYYIVDFYAEYLLNKKYKFFADFQNITNQKYFDVRGFNTKRFNATAGININL